MQLIRKVRDYIENIPKSTIISFVVIVGFVIFMLVTLYRSFDELPIKDGFIQDSSKVDMETQGLMEVETLDKAFEQSKNDYNSQMISTLFFCINTAEINDNYDCLINIIDSNARSEFLKDVKTTAINEGRILYEEFTKERILSGIDNEVIKNEYDLSKFNLTFTFMDGTKDFYYMELEQGNITKLERR